MEINPRDWRQAWERLTGNLVGQAYADRWCVTCALCAAELDFEPCAACDGDGVEDLHERDAINYAPGEEGACADCQGEGGHYWGHRRDCPSRFVPLTVSHRKQG